MTYTVFCPKTGEREIAHSQQQGIDIAESIFIETNAYVWCEDYLGWTVVEFGNPEDIGSDSAFMTDLYGG